MSKGHRQRKESVRGGYATGWDKIFGQKKKEKLPPSEQPTQESIPIKDQDLALSSK